MVKREREGGKGERKEERENTNRRIEGERVEENSQQYIQDIRTLRSILQALGPCPCDL